MPTVLAVLVLASLPGSSAPQSSSPAGASEPFSFEQLMYRDRVERDGSQVRTIEVRVLLGTVQGVAEFGQIGLGYVDGYGDVQFDDVSIEKADRHRVNVKNGLVQDINPFGVTGTSLPADVRFKSLTIPGLEPGDRLSYRISSRMKPLTPGRAFGEFKAPQFAGAVPQTYELDLPRESALKVRLRAGVGAPWEEVSSSPDRHVRRLTIKSEPAAPNQKATKADFQAQIEPDVIFTNFGDWTEVARWWWDLSRDHLKPDPSVSAEASSLVKGVATPRKQLAALHAFLTGRIRYVNVSFGLGRMQPRRAAEVLQNRYGDCKDKHALLAALATSVGLDVRPALINSMRADLWDDVPGPQQFDHMISVVRLGASPSEWLWLDGTQPFGPPGYLLPQLRDKRALLIEANGDGLVVRTPKEPPFQTRQEVTLKGALSADGVLRARVTWLFRSDAEVPLRAVFAGLSKERLAPAVQQALARDWGEATVQNVLNSDALDVASPFRVEFDVEKKVPAKGGERSLWLPLPDFELPEPAEAAAGEPIVNFGLSEMAERAEIEIPKEDSARVPLSVSLDRAFGTFRSAYSVEGRTIRLERKLALSTVSLLEAESAAYTSFRNAIVTDRKQEFSIAVAAGSGPAPSGGAELHAEGLAAFTKRDYTKAVDLLRRATEADPKLKDGFETLGRALYESGRNEDAVAAFTRQIETTPYHETAYAWRAYVLGRLNRWEDAEKDLLKQIEVAPFKAWSYEKLGERRELQQKHGEAAELYARAAAIEPKVAQRWLDLGVALAAADRPGEARKALDQVSTLDPSDWMRVKAASTYRSLGDVARAGELAQSALPALSKRLTEMAPGELDADDVYWSERLVEAWDFLGEAALAANDLARADKYLQAAWQLAFSPEAGWALGDLREKQGRLAEAVELWSMASAAPHAAQVLPRDRRTRIEVACSKLPGTRATPTPPVAPPNPLAFSRSSCESQALSRLMELRTVRLTGTALGDLAEEVLLLADVEGRVERVLNLSRRKSEALERQLAKLGPIRLASPRPDELAFKSIRRGLLVCSTVSGCAVILDLPGLAGIEKQEQGLIRITNLDPADGSTLQKGQRVSVAATVHYEIGEEDGFVALVVQDQTGKGLTEGLIAENVSAPSGDVTLKGTFTVPMDATRIEVFLPLSGPDAGSTSTVAGATYKVR